MADVASEAVAQDQLRHSERMEQEAILDLYLAALGMQTAPTDE